MARSPYPRDLSERQWCVLEPYIRGHPRTVDMREILNGIFYVVRAGCAWRQLPHDLPPWSTVYNYFRQFRKAGVWEAIHDRLPKHSRKQAGKQKTPSAAIVDSQSDKTTPKGGARATMRARR